MKGIREELNEIIATEAKDKRDTEKLKQSALSKREFAHVRISDIKAGIKLKKELEGFKL